MRWAVHVARMRRGEACTRFWWGNLKERNYWGDLGVNRSIMLRRIFMRWEVCIGTGSIWFRIGTGGGRL